MEVLKMEVARGFHWADYLVLSLMLLVSSGIGFYVAFRSGGPRTTSDYLMGGTLQCDLLSVCSQNHWDGVRSYGVIGDWEIN